MKEPYKWIIMLDYLTALCLVEIGLVHDLEVDLEALQQQKIDKKYFLYMLEIMTQERIYAKKYGYQKELEETEVITKITIKDGTTILHKMNRSKIKQYKKRIIKHHKITKFQLKQNGLILNFYELLKKYNLTDNYNNPKHL